MSLCRAFLTFILTTVAFSFFTKYAAAELKPVLQDIGKISISVDAEGNNEVAGGTIQVNKSPQATVKRAFLMASSNHGRELAQLPLAKEGVQLYHLDSLENLYLRPQLLKPGTNIFVPTLNRVNVS